jgi:hypothetical protein
MTYQKNLANQNIENLHLKLGYQKCVPTTLLRLGYRKPPLKIGLSKPPLPFFLFLLTKVKISVNTKIFYKN